MLRRGDLVKIKNADLAWKHLTNKIGIFICYDEIGNKLLSCIIKPIGCAYEIKFAEEDLEYLCSGQEIFRTFEEEHI